jgi:hypothetical protein
MSLYKFLNAESTAVVHIPTSRCIYLDQPSTIYSEAYLTWLVGDGARIDFSANYRV